MPFAHAIHPIAGEHNWRDTMFKEFFEPFGPVSGVHSKERLSFDKPPTWAQSSLTSGDPKALTTGPCSTRKARSIPRSGSSRWSGDRVW